MTYKVGDTFEVLCADKDIPCGSAKGNSRMTRYIAITGIRDDGTWYYNNLDNDFNRITNCFGCLNGSHVGSILRKLDTLNKNNKTFMTTIIEKYRLALKGEPEKSFIKKGITDINGTLTTEGKALYDAWRFEKDKTDFATEVVSMIELDSDNK